MKLTRNRLKHLINESLATKGSTFIAKNERKYGSIGWYVVTTNSELKQLTYRMMRYGNALTERYLVIYQSNPWEYDPKQRYDGPKDDINKYVISQCINGKWGKEEKIDIRNFTLIDAISSLFRQSFELMGDEEDNMRQGVELLSQSSENSVNIQAGKILSNILEPAEPEGPF